jgi:hypothetical protein
MYKNFLAAVGLFCCSFMFAQESNPFEVELNYFYGSILRHNKDITSLITGHPEGLILSYNKKTYGNQEWSRRYNYPDYGFTFAYQDLKNDNLGKTYNALAHYSFYFLNRKLMFRVGQGIGYTTNPFDIDTNVANNAYGSRFFSATLVMLNYKQPITPQISLQTGLTFLHGSNGNFKAPNTSTNTLAINTGVVYTNKPIPDYIPRGSRERYTEPIGFNFALNMGLNESDYVGLGQEPFLILTAYADKRLSKKSTILAGGEFFVSKFLKNEIEFLSVAFPSFGVTKDQDWKRAGVFVGHELRFNKTALMTHAGYYVYYPYDFEGRFYQRVGLKHYIQEKYFVSAAVKTHGAKAEAVEFGLGIRL